MKSRFTDMAPSGKTGGDHDQGIVENRRTRGRSRN
jgi:hypothetical protein